MITCPNVSKRVIKGHYDLTTIFYRLLWGPHIHHGLWDDDACSPRAAQVHLTDALADRARIAGGERLIDVGCGMGGSSIYLAKTRGCHATGVTISTVQRRWASVSSVLNGVGKRTEFRHADAEDVEFAEASADVVWSVECTEHLFDKPRFFQRASTWLKPGGRIAICAWLEGAGACDDERRQQVYDVCEGFFCPSLGSRNDYVQWMSEAGLEMDVVEDWTAKVDRTWEICRRRVERTGVRWIAKLIDRDSAMFLDRFDTILRAYRTGAMAYGCFVASKPII